MNKSRQTDNPVKALMRKLLRLAIYLNVIFNLGKRQKFSGPNVFYGELDQAMLVAHLSR